MINYFIDTNALFYFNRYQRCERSNDYKSNINTIPVKISVFLYLVAWYKNNGFYVLFNYIQLIHLYYQTITTASLRVQQVSFLPSSAGSSENRKES